MKIKFNLSWFILLAGIVFSLYLQSFIKDEVFFSGDAGIKVLLAKQFSSGQFRFDLNLSADSWVHKLWATGLFPFEPPFVYKKIQHYYITFPFTFPLISAPFYAYWGNKGLYILPLVSVWILWFRFYVICQKIALGTHGTAIALGTLIFSSPLTIYSALYWEHSLAVLLAFYGWSNILIRNHKNINKKHVVLSGILIGLSVWFRPEFLCFVAAIITMFLLGKYKISPRNNRIFITAMVFAVLLFFTINTIVYSHPLGIHSIQVVENLSIVNRIVSYCKNLFRISILLLHYFPTTFYLGIYFSVIMFAKKNIYPKNINRFLLFCTLFIVYVPLILPSPSTGGHGGKQWGSRFLLIIIPILCLLVTKKLMLLIKNFSRKTKNYCRISFLILYISGIYINTYLGALHLNNDYSQRVLPALQFIQSSKIKVVAVANSSISQELEAAFDKKVFFLTKTPEDLKKLSTALIEQGYQEFLYVCNTSETLDSLQFTVANQVFAVEDSNLGQFGSYHLFLASIRRLI